jgi:hypothetical protein
MPIATSRIGVQLRYESAVLDPDARELADWIDQRSASGEEFRDGHTVQIGWMVTRLRAVEGGLIVMEPDFRSFPVQWVDSVERTLMDQRRQVYALDSVGIDRLKADFPSLSQSAIACSRFAAGGDWMASRTPAKDRDSGCFFGCADGGHELVQT